MKGKLGNKNAGDLTSQSLMMIVSILAVTVFIGAAIQPALSVPIVNKDPRPAAVEEEYTPCDCEKQALDTGTCKSCINAVFHAVKYTKDYVRNTFKDKDVYFLWTADLAIVVVEGLILGLKDSGFKITIDLNELNNTITYWVNKLWGPQMFLVTRFMARLGAIYIGITWYLLSFCVCTSRIIPT